MLNFNQNVDEYINLKIDSGVYSQLEKLQKYYSELENKEYSLEAIAYKVFLFGFFREEEKILN